MRAETFSCFPASTLVPLLLPQARLHKAARVILSKYKIAWLVSKKQEVTNIGEDVEKTEPLCLIGVNVDWCGHCGDSVEHPQKIKNGNTR